MQRVHAGESPGPAPPYWSRSPEQLLADLQSSAAGLTAFTPLPGGGGVCETTLVLIMTRLGIALEVSLGATLLYRALTFWLPLLLSALIAPQLFKGPAIAGSER